MSCLFFILAALLSGAKPPRSLEPIGKNLLGWIRDAIKTQNVMPQGDEGVFRTEKGLNQRITRV